MTNFLHRKITRRTALIAGAGLAAYVALGASKCATIAQTAIRNARIFTGTGEIIDGGTIAVYNGPSAGGIIIAVGPDDEVQLGNDTLVFNVDRAFVMPGLIDTHVHVTEALLNGSPILQSWLRAGITTLRDTGTIWQGPALLRSLAEEHGPGPRIIATGGLFTAPDGYPTSRGPTGVAGSKIVANIPEAIQGVHDTLDAGAEFIKVAIENGRPGGSLHLDAGFPMLSLEQVRAIVETAHARGAPVTAHVTNQWELRVALDAAVDSLAHTPIDIIPPALIRRIVAANMPMTATSNIWDGGEFTRNVQRNVKALADAGGIVAMGTDFPFQVHDGVPHGELALMEDAGLTREQVLLSCTRDAALACARNDIGVIEAGRAADILVLNEDPLEDLAALANPRFVMQAGTIVSQPPP